MYCKFNEIEITYQKKLNEKNYCVFAFSSRNTLTTNSQDGALVAGEFESST